MESSVIRNKKRINIELPEMIIAKLDGLARQLNSSRVELIRRFLDEKVAEKEKEELERSLRDGYLANYDFIKESGCEWDATFPMK